MTIELNKKCRDCKTILIPSDNWKPSAVKRRDYLCKSCRRDKSKANYAKDLIANRKKGREKARNWRKNNPVKALAADLRPFGLTVDGYNQLVKDQNGVCKLCDRFRPNKRAKRLCVDHDHKTGKIRGLLCDPCNRSLGVLGDTVEQFERILAYLKIK